MSNLPFVLLGIRSALRNSYYYSHAHLTYGGPLRLPGEFFSTTAATPVPDTSAFVAHLRGVLRAASPFPADHHATQSLHLPSSLLACDSVFVRVDSVKRPLTPPYSGPYTVLRRDPKVFVLDRSGKEWTVSVDRLKPLETPSSSLVDLAPPSMPSSLPVESTPTTTAVPSVRPTPTSDSAFPDLPLSSGHPLSSALRTRSGRLVRPPQVLDL